MQSKESEAAGRISGLERKVQYAEIEKVRYGVLARGLFCRIKFPSHCLLIVELGYVCSQRSDKI